jgi:ribonuclease-3
MILQEDRKQALERFQNILGYHFKDLALLNNALTHRSFANEQGGEGRDNERLEFLGDAVLNLITSHYLIDRFPHYAEGDLTKQRAAIVNNIDLARMAHQIQLGEFILLGKGEDRSGGQNKPSILAGCFEALIASLYLEAGLEKASSIFFGRWENSIEEIITNNGSEDYKSILQEFVQRELACMPVYEVVKDSGPEHRKTFEVVMIIKGQICSYGAGRSKKEAEQEAAMLALETFQKEGLPF